MLPGYLATVPTTTEIDQALLNIQSKERSNLFPWNGQFSPQLVEVLLKKYAPKNGVVLDPFGGSGTVLHECGRERYSAIACEINPAAFTFSRLYELINVPKDLFNLSDARAVAKLFLLSALKQAGSDDVRDDIQNAVASLQEVQPSTLYLAHKSYRQAEQS